MSKFKEEIIEVKIDKLVNGGQGLGTMSDGRKVFVWNALPGEMVRARTLKQKRSYSEAIAEEIITASVERIQPLEQNYLATSPWQIMTFAAENKYKKMIVEELFAHDKVSLPTFGETLHQVDEWHYRNKMEYSFWGDDDGIHLALHLRGSHGKEIVHGSELAMAAVDAGANAICQQLSSLGTRAGDLKTIIVRCDQEGNTVAALYVKLEKFTELTLPKELKGLRVYYSNPLSPASVPTRLLQESGELKLHDQLLGRQFTYDVDSFFQVNLPIFEKALERIKELCKSASLVDMYAGVGSIGLSVASERVNLIELDAATAAMARINANASGLDANVIESPTEKVLKYISGAEPVVFDPPRAGLHDNVIARVLEVQPSQIIYLSCNPSTHARDLAKLQGVYTIDFFEIYNFFPRTPHIETLAVLSRTTS